MDYARYEPGRYAPDRDQAARQGQAALKALRGLLPGNKKQRILEVGCGGGGLLFALRHHGYEWCSGVDSDPRLVEHARRVLGLDIRCSTWREHLETTQDEYDAVIALDVMEHLERQDVVPTLQATRARLAPGGRLIVRTPNALCPLVLATFCGDLTHRFLPTPKLVTHLVRQAGFDGAIRVCEAWPTGFLARTVFAVLHSILVKPVVSLVYYHFHGEFPRIITANMIVCAEVPGP